MYKPILRKFSGKRLFLGINFLLFFYFTSSSQTKNGSQSPFTLDINAGLALPNGTLKNYANKGFETGLLINKALYKNLALGLNTHYQQLGINDKFNSPDNSWRAISLGIGPQYTLPLNYFFVQFNAHLGVNFIKSPALHQQQVGKPDYFKENMTVFQLESGQKTGFYSSAGIKAGMHLSERINVFLGSSYSTDLNKAVSYQYRDLSNALHESGEVHVDVINSTPFEEKKLSFSNLGVNLGITINLGKLNSKASAQDYNSSRSNRPTPVKPDITNGKDTIPLPVQDYNSSRSNRPRPIATDTTNHEKDTVARPAQDYNSSRSNKPRPIATDTTNHEKDTVARPAQDYNSSRSNKPSPIGKAKENEKAVIKSKKKKSKKN